MTSCPGNVSPVFPSRDMVAVALEEVGTFPPNPEEVVVWAWVLPVLEAYRDGRLVPNWMPVPDDLGGRIDIPTG